MNSHVCALCRRVVFLLACFMLLPLNAAAWERGKVERFATLPAGSPNPEGVAVDSRNGDVYVTGFMPTQPAGPGKVFVFDREGDLKRTLLVTGSSNALLGIDFHPDSHELLVVDFGGAKVLRVNPFSGAATVFTAPIGALGLNALGFDKAGNVYISDSGRGTIWRTGPGGGAAEDFVTHPLLTTTGFPPFGANGLDFNRDGSVLFVANTGNDTVVRVKTATKAVDVFTNSINGADGLFVDEHDNIWVCANQSDEIVVVDKTGKAISKLGDFNGVRNGSPVGLLFPASLARHGDWIYITNLSLDTRTIGLPQSVDSQWAAQVKRHTISRIRARVLGFERGGDD
jgi:DNA-binding beta-propeller fold protein YncE